MDQDHEYFDKNEWVNDEKSFTEKVAVLLPPEVVDECKLMDWSYCSSCAFGPHWKLTLRSKSLMAGEEIIKYVEDKTEARFKTIPHRSNSSKQPSGVKVHFN